MKKIKPGTIVLFVLMLALFVLLSNPALIPFIGQEARAELQTQADAAFCPSGEGFGITLPRLLTAAAVTALVLAVYIALKLLLGLVGRGGGRRETVCRMLRSLVKYAAVLVGIFWCLSVLGVNTAAMFASVGVIALIIGFGAQSLIEDVITGLFIIFEGQYSVGDVIIVDDFRGTVKSIGVRTTVLEDAGGNLKIVNNSDIRNLQNRSQNPSFALCDISIGYSQSIEKAEKVLEDAFETIWKKYDGVFTEKPIYLGVQELGQSGVTLRAGAAVLEKDVFRAQRLLNRELKLAFDAAGIEIPFAQLVIHRAADK